MNLLRECTIKTYILPYLSRGKRGKTMSDESYVPVIQAILHRLKTGCQWRQLPIREFFGNRPYTWEAVYYHFQQWSKHDCWRNVWVALLRAHKGLLDLSQAELDGTLTRAHRGGEAVGFQGRRQDQCTNLLAISDSKGTIIAISEPISGEHHDLFDIKTSFGQLLEMLTAADIAIDGLFLNADSGFDAATLRDECEKVGIIPNFALNPRNGNLAERDDYFDPEIYKGRYVIEHGFGWMDAFKALLIRYEVLAKHWRDFNLLGMTVLFIRKIIKNKKKKS